MLVYLTPFPGHSLIHSFIHSLIHSSIHSFIHSFIHSLIIRMMRFHALPFLLFPFLPFLSLVGFLFIYKFTFSLSSLYLTLHQLPLPLALTLLPLPPCSHPPSSFPLLSPSFPLALTLLHPFFSFSFILPPSLLFFLFPSLLFL